MADPNFPPPPPGFTLDTPAQSPFGSRPVIQEAPPPPKEPKTTYRPLTAEEIAQNKLPPGSYQISSEGNISKIADAPEGQSPAQTITRDLSSDHAITQIGVARQQIGEGHDTGNFFGTKGYQSVPFLGQNSANLAATLEGLKGGVINDTIAALKAQSSNGSSGYGALSETEADRIAGAIAAIQQSQDQKSLLSNLNELETHYRAARAILNNEDPRDPAVAKKYGINPLSQAYRLTPQEQKQFFDTLHNQGPDAANAFLAPFGLSLKSKDAAAKPHSEQIDYQPPEDTPPDNSGGGLGRAFAVGLGGVAQGIGDTLGVVSNPFIQGVNGIFGTDYRPDMGANLRDTLGLPAPQNNQEQLINRINDYGTQGLNFALAAKAAAAKAPGAIGSALEALGNRPLTDSATAAAGGGAGELTRQAGGGPLLQTAATIAAGVPTAAIGSRLDSALTRSVADVPPVVNAGRQEGVTVNRAMVDPGSHQKLTAVGKTMVGGRMMQRDMGNIRDQIEGRVQALGRNGDKMEPVVAGQRIQDIAGRSIKQSGAQLGRRYDRLEKATAGVKVPPTEASARADEIISRLSETPGVNKAEISYLKTLKGDLSNDLSIGALRRLRTKLRKSISKGELTFGEDEADVLSIMDAASNDIANGLRAQGKAGVAKEFQAVDGAYRDRMEFIKGTLQKVIGKRGANLSGEQVFANLKALTTSRGDSAGLARLVREMSPEEQFDYASTLADALGKDADGNFSTAKLATHINAMPPATRVAAFGEEGAKSLQNIAELAKSHKNVMKALGGSPTGVANDYRSFILNSVLGLGAGGLSGSTVKGMAVAGALTGAKVGRDAINARLLMSPKIAGWLRSAPKTNNAAAINAHFDRLKAIAVREPALAPEINRLQSMILKAANENFTPSAAASQPNQGGGNQ